MKVNQLLLTEKEMFSRLHMFMFCYENIEVKTNTSFIGFVDESDNLSLTSVQENDESLCLKPCLLE